MDVGIRIRDLRKSKKLTLEQLASQAAVTAAHLSKIENGKSALSRRVLEQIAAVLEVAPSELLANSEASAPVLERRGRSAVERFCLDWFAREMYADVTAGKALAESGWRAPSDVGRASTEKNEDLLRGLVALGTVAARDDDGLFRLDPAQHKQNPLVQSCIQIQDYRDASFGDARRLAVAETQVNELFDSLIAQAGNQSARTAILTAGWGLAIREARCDLKADELISIGATTIDFDSIRQSAAGNIAAQLLATQGANSASLATASTRGLRELWHSLPACRASRHLFCNLYHEDTEHARAIELIVGKLTSSLNEAGESLLLTIASAWVIWCYLVTQGSVPHAEEHRSSVWGNEVLELVNERFPEVPHSLRQCHEAIDSLLASLDIGGVSNEDVADAAAIARETRTSLESDGRYWQTLELIRFPWDNA